MRSFEPARPVHLTRGPIVLIAEATLNRHAGWAYALERTIDPFGLRLAVLRSAGSHHGAAELTAVAGECAVVRGRSTTGRGVAPRLAGDDPVKAPLRLTCLCVTARNRSSSLRSEPWVFQHDRDSIRAQRGQLVETACTEAAAVGVQAPSTAPRQPGPRSSTWRSSTLARVASPSS
jgi:hypothetical protein